MKKIDYTPNALSHHNENIQYWVTQGIVIDGERYSVEELFIRSGNLYGVISKDKITFYEHQLSSNLIQNNYDDKDIKDRISRLEEKEIPRYDDTGLQQRVSSLEEKENSEISNIKTRLEIIENKKDNDNQVLSIDENKLSISGGNSVLLPNYPKYDDSNIKYRLLSLESKEDKDSQLLSINGNNLSISGGNSVELSFKDTIVTSSSHGVNINKSIEENSTKFDINIDEALSNYYDKSKTYTKDEVEKLISNQEQKSTDINVYKGQFSNRQFVLEGDYDTAVSPRITLTYSSSTGVGIFKIDFKIIRGVPKGFIIAKLPDNSPVPVELVESQVWVGNTSTSVWIDKGSNLVKISATSNNDIFNKRIILSIPGIFKKR